MDVTIVIPNYNGMKYIDACVKSIYAGTVIPQLIIVDNGSVDDSCNLIREHYPQCLLVCFAENRGFCSAVNEGIRLAETEYVILLNNDTVVDERFTERLTEAIRTREDAFSVCAKLLSMQQPELIDDAGDLYCALGWAYARGKGKHKTAYAEPAEIFAACAGAAVYRKSVFDIIGYFDENHFAYLEDIDIGYRAKLSGYHNYYTPDALVYHAGSAASGSRYNEFKVRLASRNSVYLIAKNMPVLQAVLNLPFLLPGFLTKAIFFTRKGMGNVYIKGIIEGIVLSLSEEGKARRVAFRREYLGNYVRVQLNLWENVFRRIWG